jgi:hypothetical protein
VAVHVVRSATNPPNPYTGAAVPVVLE